MDAAVSQCINRVRRTLKKLQDARTTIDMEHPNCTAYRLEQVASDNYHDNVGGQYMLNIIPFTFWRSLLAPSSLRPPICLADAGNELGTP